MANQNYYELSDPQFPAAMGTQKDSLSAARKNDLGLMIHEFRHAKKDGWAEWVAARTPFGQEAFEAQNWTFQDFDVTCGGEEETELDEDGFPRDFSIRSNGPETYPKREQLRDLLEKIDDHIKKSDPRQENFPTREVLNNLILSTEGFKISAALIPLVLFLPWSPIGWNPLQWHTSHCAIAAGFMACYTYAFLSVFFTPPQNVPFIPGVGLQRDNDLNLGDAKLHELLDKLRVSPEDDVIAYFGNWQYFKSKTNITISTSLNFLFRFLLKAATFQTLLRETHLIKFIPLASDTDIDTNVFEADFKIKTDTGTPFIKRKPYIWNVETTDLRSIPEGPCIFFVYRVNRTFGDSGDSSSFPIGLVSITGSQNWQPFCFDVSTDPIFRKAFVSGILGIPAGWLANLILGIIPSGIFFVTIWPSLISYLLGFMISFFIIRGSFHSKLRDVLTDLAMKENHKQALIAEYMRLQNPAFSNDSGRL